MLFHARCTLTLIVVTLLSVDAKGKGIRFGDNVAQGGEETPVRCEDIREELIKDAECFGGSHYHEGRAIMVGRNDIIGNIDLIQLLLLVPDPPIHHHRFIKEHVHPRHQEWILYIRGKLRHLEADGEYVVVVLSKYDRADNCFAMATNADNKTGLNNSYDAAEHDNVTIPPLPHATMAPQPHRSVIHKTDNGDTLDEPASLGWTFIDGTYYNIYENRTMIFLKPIILESDIFHHFDIIMHFNTSSEYGNNTSNNTSNNSSFMHLKAETQSYWLTGHRSLIGRALALYALPKEHNSSQITSHKDLVLKKRSRIACGVVGYVTPFAGGQHIDFVPVSTSARPLCSNMVTTILLLVSFTFT